MSYQSPYHDPSPAEQRQRELISRGAMLLFGLLLAYLGVHGLLRCAAVQSAAATQPVVTPVTHGRGGGNPNVIPPLVWIGLGLLAVFGSLTAAAALVPVALLEKVLSPFNSAPITGDRSLGLDDDYDGPARHWRRARWWW